MERQPLTVPTRQNERWSMDFISDRLSEGPKFRSLNIMDDFSRECLAAEVDTSLPGARVVVFVYSRIATPVFIDRVFINSSAVVPIVFAYPLTAQKGPKGRILYGFLGLVLGATTALSGFGYLRYEEKEDWRGATSSLLRIPEKNRMIIFISSTSEILFDYYARRSPAMAPTVEKTGFPVSFYERFPPPPRRIIDASDINRLKLAVESKKYSEIDLVLSHEKGHDPNGLVFDYLNRVFVLQEEQRFYGIRIVRFLAPPHLIREPATVPARSDACRSNV